MHAHWWCTLGDLSTFAKAVALVEMKYSFSISPEKDFGEVTGVFSLENTHQTLVAEASDASPVSGVCWLSSAVLSGTSDEFTLDTG